MGLSWIAVEARTGKVIADLPGLVVPRVGVTLGSYFTTTGSLPVGGSGPSAPPENWRRATLPKATCLVLVDDDSADPLWGALVVRRVRSGGDEVALTLSTWEVHLDDRYVGDETYTAEPQCDIVADLLDQFVLDGTVPLVVEGSGGEPRDRTYEDALDKTVLAALTELSGVQGGPEWTITWRHLTAPERYVPVLTVADRVGAAVQVGMGPAATFEMPGPVSVVELVEDWTRTKGATSVVATSTATAAVRPQSPAQSSADPDRPTIEHRFTPSTSITQVATLTEHAARALAVLRHGSQALTLSADFETSPRLGLVWSVGDDIGYKIGGPVPELESEIVSDAFVEVFEDAFGSVAVTHVPAEVETVPAFPGGLAGVARAIGWELDLAEPATVTPILAVEGI